MTVHNETARLAALRRLDLLDTPPSEAFDRITRMAARLFDLPIAAVSLTDADRQWFKSKVGVEHWSIPRLGAPCATVCDADNFLVIPDLLADEHFRDSPLAASGVRFYAGAPLTDRDGHTLGAMCVLGTAPRQITAAERDVLTDLAAMVMAQIELQHTLGRIDPISHLPNRNQFLDDFADLPKARPHGAPALAVLLHLASPAQLANAARVMSSCYLDAMVNEAVRSLSIRLGGTTRMYQLGPTQVALIAPQGTSAATCRAALASWVDERDLWSTSRFVTTPAAGIAPFTVGETAALDVLRFAESAVQDAFAAGAAVAVYSSAQDAAYLRRFTLLNEFGRALAQPDQLRLVFQPRVDLASGACVGAEALLRWRHPQLGDVSPAEFMPIVEQTSMARPTTAWVIDAALRQMTAWRAAGFRLPLSVNVSAPNLLEADFADRVLARLRQHDIEPGQLELEVTESAAMENLATAHATLARLHGAGVRVAIDDFGTGYSSLAYLQSIPAHVVKIDQSFVRGMEHDARKASLVTAMIGLSHDLGYRVVAEGVETDHARVLLREAACDEAQGYFFARPLEPAALCAWLRERAPGQPLREAALVE